MISAVSTGSNSQLPDVGTTGAHVRPHGHHRVGGAALASKIISSADSDGDGSISKDELAAMLAKNTGSTSTATDLTSKVNDLFQQLDSDGDGKVSKAELTAALQKSPDSMTAGVSTTGTSTGLDSLIGALMPAPPTATYNARGSSTLIDNATTFSAVA